MLRVCHLYPDLFNFCGDRGNVIAFVQRCRWRNIAVSIEAVNLGDPVDFTAYDFVFLGGGSEHSLIAADLMKHRHEFAAAIEDGLVVLAIGGGYQLLGKYYLTPAQERVPGLGLLDFYTRAGEQRLVGNIAVELVIDGVKYNIIGFENHSGKTYLGNVKPLGKVLSGYGNNGVDGFEGARYKNVYCSYLHGPLLPKNSRLTDRLITLSMKKHGLQKELKPLDDSLENSARSVMLERLLEKKR
jgi:CobQ-like glutamine amidotransferase family enzyme